jgi:hypothetical protein
MITPKEKAFEFEKKITNKNIHSVYTHCLSCYMWGVNIPFEKECGNCGSLETLTYYDSETINNYLNNENE